MPTPEEKARQVIDQRLLEAGWVLQDRDQFDRNAALGVAVREFATPAGPCDYLLVVEGKAAGVIEAKPAGTTLSGVAEQSEGYAAELPKHLARWGEPLPFLYESTGIETNFRDQRDPKPRSRSVFAFHRPETLLGWLKGRKETERFKRFAYKDLIARDKLNLDIFWLKDDSLTDAENLPAPEVLAAEIVETLEAALEEFRAVALELNKRPAK